MPLLGPTGPWQHMVRPDTLLVVLPCADAVTVLRAMQGRAVALSSSPSALEAALVLVSGAHAYLPTSSSPDEVRDALALVEAGGLALSAHGATGLSAVLAMTTGPEAVLAAAGLAARGMSWALAQQVCGLDPREATVALQAAAGHAG
jgi:DNA-binding NarL/FixJ family response regulator